MSRMKLGFLTICLIAACTPYATTPANGMGGDLEMQPGQTAAYRLYTHCGVLSATINHTTFYGDPALGDGNGNPPAGWGNPFDDGEMTLTTATTADFNDHSGNRAHFTARPAGPTPTIPMCD